jgi:UDP-glucose 4-epimerase
MSQPEFSNSRVLVTGGAGFVGGNLVTALLERGAQAVHVIDNLLSSERWNVPDDERVRFTEGSLAEPDVVRELRDEYDYVFHLSTYHGNQSSIHDPVADHEHNQLPTLLLFEHLKEWRNTQKIVYAGAGCAVAAKTFDRAHATPEDAPVSLDMDSPYSISKIVGEFYAVYYHRAAGLPVVRARFQNVYGPREILGAGRWRGTPATVWRNVTPSFVYRALKGMPLQIEGDGRASRDFIFVEDIVRGLLACALRGAPGDVYNLASGVETSIHDLARTIVEVSESRSVIEFVPGRPWDRSGRRFGSTDKSARQLAFRAEVPLREGLRSTIAWTRANVSRIEQTMDRHTEQLRAYAQSHPHPAA